LFPVLLHYLIILDEGLQILRQRFCVLHKDLEELRVGGGEGDDVVDGDLTDLYFDVFD
jgi:hypothetical protein